MKGVDKPADMLETSPAAVCSWMGGTGQFAAADETGVSSERDAGDRQDFTGLLRKARMEMYSNATQLFIDDNENSKIGNSLCCLGVGRVLQTIIIRAVIRNIS